jgi:phage-related minor tail protein
MSIINKYITYWPGGKPHADSLINSSGDILFGTIGWFIAKIMDQLDQLDQLAQLRKQAALKYQKHKQDQEEKDRIELQEKQKQQQLQRQEKERIEHQQIESMERCKENLRVLGKKLADYEKLADIYRG